MEVVKKPAKISMSRNIIAYHVKTNDQQIAFLRLELSLETYYYSGEYKKIALLSAPPDKEGNVIFFLNYELDQALFYDLPDLENHDFQKHKFICRKYKVKIFEGDDPKITEQFLVLKGGFSFAKFANRATKLIPENTTIFTIRPRKRYISYYQKEYLTFCFPKAGNYTINFQINYKEKNQAPEKYTKKIAFKSYEPIMVPVGFPSQNYHEKKSGIPIKNITIGMTDDISFTTVIPGTKPLQVEKVSNGMIIRRNDGVGFLTDDNLDKGTYPLHFNFKVYPWDYEEGNNTYNGFVFMFDYHEEDKKFMKDDELFIPNYRFGMKTAPDVPYNVKNRWLPGLMRKREGVITNERWIYYGKSEKTQTHTIPSDGEVVTLIPYENCTPNYSEFYWVNSLGGIDSIFSVGESKKILSVKQHEFQHYLPLNYRVSDGEFKTYLSKMRESRSVFLGFIAENEMLALRDFLASTHKFERINNQFVPIKINEGDYVIHDDANNLQILEIKYQYQFYEPAFDPIF